MRHIIAGRKLNRKTSHRRSLLKNLSKSLITHEQIETTLPKAKDLRPFVEKVFNVLGKRYQKRNGGYVRILKSGFRFGDSAPKAIIELVERDVNVKGLEDKLREKNSKKETENSPPENNVYNAEQKKTDNLALKKGKDQTKDEAVDKKSIKKD